MGRSANISCGFEVHHAHASALVRVLLQMIYLFTSGYRCLLPGFTDWHWFMGDLREFCQRLSCCYRLLAFRIGSRASTSTSDSHDAASIILGGYEGWYI